MDPQTPAPALRAHLRARCRTLNRIRSRLLDAARTGCDRAEAERRVARVDALLARLGAVYFEARQPVPSVPRPVRTARP